MEREAIVWLALFVILLIVELLTVGLTSIWFAGGALAALVLELLGVDLIWQIGAFILVSFVLVYFTRPFAVKYVNAHHEKTNYEQAVGKIVRITQRVDDLAQTGKGILDGMEWTVRTDSKEVLEKDTLARVIRISGVKLIVEPYKEDYRMGLMVLGVLLVLVILILAANIRIVPQAHAYILERLGGYKETWGVGIHFKIPILDRVAKRVSLKEQVVDFEPQAVITKDNVTMQIDTVIFFQITDPKQYAYGVENPIAAIENLTATTLRNIIGDLELDETLTSRETINSEMRTSLDIATDPWGIKVNRVELKNIMPPTAIQDAMEKQMKAERERREAILKAEGEKKSTILVAEGKKESLILEAEAEKQAAILNAEAEKQKRIKEAEGQAEAIRTVQKATAEGIEFIKQAGADDAVLTLKSLEAFAKAADGRATKIIIPSELQGIAGLTKTIAEVARPDKAAE